MDFKLDLPKRLVKFLKKHKVYSEVHVHPKTFTALETAEVEHIPGRTLAKVVMVKAGTTDAMVVLPANRVVDLLKLSAALGIRNVRVESEKEFSDLFPDCETGAMPPFGKLYGIPCFLDESLESEDYIYFNSGNHRETLRVAAADFFRISKAVKGDFSINGKKIKG